MKGASALPAVLAAIQPRASGRLRCNIRHWARPTLLSGVSPQSLRKFDRKEIR